MNTLEQDNFEYRKAALESATMVFSDVQSTDVVKLALGLEHYLRTGKNSQDE